MRWVGESDAIEEHIVEYLLKKSSNPVQDVCVSQMNYRKSCVNIQYLNEFVSTETGKTRLSSSRIVH